MQIAKMAPICSTEKEKESLEPEGDGRTSGWVQAGREVSLVERSLFCSLGFQLSG